MVVFNMKRKILFYIFILSLIFSSILFLSINNKYIRHDNSSPDLQDSQPETIPKNIVYGGDDLPSEIITLTEDSSVQTDLRDEDLRISGPVNEVPWEDDTDFLNTLDQNGTHTLLAAFRTVLKDPLPGEEFNVHLAARLLKGTIVKPLEIFSQNIAIGPYTQSRGYQKGPTYIGSNLTTTYGGGVCKISSTLYNVAVLSNLQVIERHAHSMPVPYVPYGQDATVAYGAKDFKFKNTSDSPILIWALGVENTLYIALYGNYTPPKIEWEHEIIRTYKAPVIYKINNELPSGEEKIILEGMDGAVVRSWINIQEENGAATVKQMGTSYYTPMSHIIEKGK